MIKLLARSVNLQQAQKILEDDVSSAQSEPHLCGK
jgi:rRNA processing protein Krr1/Pno1